ncbi:hypothetical protein [Aquella oligotrophica]|uniref:Uncharacterized protein n=1 Tax=Aquella oligotrophica TaxID=2067065 RepID=A0A2I7N8J1_9NEIS|nr:hypothetical protein [Aquella oligotrophica]AUR52777.1 hypothetical protein CUN60_10900 [Aquella oligotrophica]
MRTNQKNSMLLLLCSLGLLACNGGGSSGSSPNYTGSVYMILGNNSIQKCPVGGNQVNFNNCQTINGNGLFESPTAIAFDNAGNYAYITNQNNSVTECAVDSNGMLNSCIQLGNNQNWFSSPSSILIQNNLAYVANQNGTIAQCNIESNGQFSSCNNFVTIVSFSSITANGNQLYGLTSPILTSLYTCDLNNLSGCTQVSFESSSPGMLIGSPFQIYYNNQQNLLYGAYSNSIVSLGLLGGGIYGCTFSNSNSVSSCSNSYLLGGFIGALPTSASIYTLTTDNVNNGYFIDYYENYNIITQEVQQKGTFLNACNIGNDGSFNNCTMYQLNSDNLYFNTNGNLYIAYLNR